MSIQQSYPAGAQIIEFELRPVEDREKTEVEGHMVYRDEEFVKVTSAGANSVFESKVTDELKARYQDHYKAWKSGEEVPIDGLALDMWPAISPAELKNVKGMGIRSVEELATIPDANLSRMSMSIRSLHSKALAWLNSAEDTGKSAATIARMRVELDDKSRDIERLTSSMTSLEAEVRVLTRQTDETPKRGRPRKEV